MNCIHGGTVGLCRQCEHDGPKLAADPRDARDCGDCVSFTHVAAERDRLAARVAELEAQANRWQDVANETAANYWRLTQERNRLRLALDAVHVDSVACAPESGPRQYCITEWALSKVREALAAMRGDEPVTNCGAASPTPDASGTPTPSAAGSPAKPLPDQAPDPRCDCALIGGASASRIRCPHGTMIGAPDPTAARLARAKRVASDAVVDLAHCEADLRSRGMDSLADSLRETRHTLAGLSEPPTSGEAEHAALLRVAKAALDYWVYETKTNREGLRAALTELRRARAGKDGGSDG